MRLTITLVASIVVLCSATGADAAGRSRASATATRKVSKSISLDPEEGEGESAGAPTPGGPAGSPDGLGGVAPIRGKKNIANADSKGTVGIRGKEDLELNCPSISYKFPTHSTLRCESCKTLGRILHYSIVYYYREVEDMLISGPSNRGPELCVIAPLVTELRQKTNGKRFWDLTRLMKDGDFIEHSPYVDHDYDPLPASDRPEIRKREIRAGRTGGFGESPVEDTQAYPEGGNNDKAVSVNNRHVTYHTRQERETLPCANYFLNRYCTAEYLGDDETSDAVDGCVAAYTGSKKAAEASILVAVKKRQQEQRIAGEAVGDSVDLEAAERRRAQSSTEQRSTSLLNCLVGKICGSLYRKECDTRQLVEMQKLERDEFLRYEALHGDKKHPFVGTSMDARKLERNPYAKTALGASATASGEL